jgi:hypothetical protein
MRFAALAVIFLGLAPASALAEPDYMEAQRCIWRCLANSKGVEDPAYNRCIARDCDGNGSSSNKRRGAKWTYGEHPVLGMSAWVAVGEEAFGVACKVSDYHPGNSAGATIRMTPGLVPAATEKQGAVSVYLQPFAVGAGRTFKADRRGFVEYSGNACEAGLPRLRRSKALLFLQERMLPSQTVAGDTPQALVVDGPAGPVAITQVSDLNQLGEAVRVPLAGAPAALDKLARDCPALRRQMRQDCTGSF